jgi:hypothetical protein
MTKDREPEIFVMESSPEDLLGRACDFLHRHSGWADTDPVHLPPQVSLYFIHLGEHMLRYIGAMPSPEQVPFHTPHMWMPEPGKHPSHGGYCDDDYFRYMTTEEALQRVMEAGINPNDPEWEAAYRRVKRLLNGEDDDESTDQ